jgi:integrase
MKKVKLLFYPNKVKRSAKTMLVPIYLRLSKSQHNKVEARLDVSISVNDVKHWNYVTQRLDIPNNSVNLRLEEIQDEYDSLKYKHKESYLNFSPLEVKEKILKLENYNVNSETKIIDYAVWYYNTIVIPNTGIVDGTKNNYKKSIKHFKNYLQFKNILNCLITKLDSEIALGFYDYLQQDIPAIGKRGITDVSASSIIDKIKNIYERAFDTDLIKKNPFKKIKLQKKSPKRDELNITEIKSLCNIDLNNNRKLEVYRDIFLFLIFTGIPHGDFYNLTWNDIQIENNQYILEIKRRKTGVTIKQVLVAQAVKLMHKYKEDYETMPMGRIFPQRHLNNVNDYLKIIQSLANINKKLSTHIGRHTCRQLLGDLGSVNTDVINTMQGWSNSRLGSSMIYRRTSMNMLMDAKIKYEEFLSKNL